MRRITALLLAAIMCLSFMTEAAFATDEVSPGDGTGGTTVETDGGINQTTEPTVPVNPPVNGSGTENQQGETDPQNESGEQGGSETSDGSDGQNNSENNEDSDKNGEPEDPKVTNTPEPTQTPSSSPVVTPSPSPSAMPDEDRTFTAFFGDNTDSGFTFALTDRPDNTYKAGDMLSFGFTDMNNADKDLYENFTWKVTMENAVTPLFVGANDDNSLFTLYSDEGKTTPAAATGNVHIVLTGKTAKQFNVTVLNDTENPIVLLPSATAEAKEDYVFYVAQPQYLDPLPEDFVSVATYALPVIKIKGIEFYGYTLEKITEPKTFGEKTYTCCWEFTIPGEYVTGDIDIDANKHSITETNYTVNMTAVSGFVPYSENEKMLGTAVVETDAIGSQAYTYYFYYEKSSPYAAHPIYSVDGVDYPLNPQPVYGAYSEESSVYKINDITGNVTVSLAYNVTKTGSGNNEEALIELPSETVKPGESYKFKVRTHDMTETQLQISVSMGGSALEIAGVPGKDELGTYAEYTVPYVTGDIVVKAQSNQTVQCRVKFADAYNSSETLKYSAFDYTSTALAAYSSETHIGEIAYNGTGLTFTILNRPLYKSYGTLNVDGSAPDPNTGCYKYEVTATMGGKPVAVTPYNGQYIVNNGGVIIGDVLIKTNLTLSSYECAVNGAEKVTVSNGETYIDSSGKTTYTGRKNDKPTYRYLFAVKAKNPSLTQKIYIRQYEGTTIKRTFTITEKRTVAMIYGDLVKSNIAVTALGADEVEVYVTGSKAANVAFEGALHDYGFYHGGIAKKGADFTFTVSPAAKITIKSDGNILTLGTEYTAAYDGTAKAYVYKIPAAYMTSDIQIAAYSNYNVYYTGAEYAKPLNKSYKKKDSAAAGKDYVFTLSGSTVTIKTVTVDSDGKIIGGVTLVKGKDYTVSGKTYTISAKSITGDLVIDVPVKKSSGRSGGYTSRTYGDVELDIGSELFMTLDNKKTMYLVVVYGEPEDGRHVCFDNRKMIRSDAYDAYVWLEISDMDYDEFEEYALDKVDLLYEREMRENLEKENPDEKIEILPMEEIYNLNEDYEVICDVNEDGAVDEDDLKLMRQMFAGAFEDFDEIPMRSFICADVDMSYGLDMLDAAMIKYNFDKDEDEEQEQNEEN